MSTGSFDFAHGDCAVFAVALSRVTGFPIRALVEFAEELETTVLVHAYVWAGEVPYPVIDVNGPTSLQDILDRYPHEGSPEEVTMTEDEVMSLNYGDQVSWPDWRAVLPAAHEVLKAMQAQGTQPSARL